MKISAIIHTRNSEQTLKQALTSVRWVDELLVVDMSSTDRTVEFAEAVADRVISIAPADRVDGVRNRYLEEASGEWLLVLDSDEWLAEDAGEELRCLLLELGSRFDAFALPRFNTICGQVMRGGQWYPDHQIRLFRRGTVLWEDSHHRPPRVITGPERLFELVPPDCPHIHHHNYSDLREFVLRQASYACTDWYDENPASFDWPGAVTRAHRALALRHDQAADGDLSHALALLMAWDEIVRGLLHWDSLRPRPSLDKLVALPPKPLSILPRAEVALRRWLGRRHSMRFLLHRLRDRFRGLLRRLGLAK